MNNKRKKKKDRKDVRGFHVGVGSNDACSVDCWWIIFSEKSI